MVISISITLHHHDLKAQAIVVELILIRMIRERCSSRSRCGAAAGSWESEAAKRGDEITLCYTYVCGLIGDHTIMLRIGDHSAMHYTCGTSTLMKQTAMDMSACGDHTLQMCCNILWGAGWTRHGDYTMLTYTAIYFYNWILHTAILDITLWYICVTELQANASNWTRRQTMPWTKHAMHVNTFNTNKDAKKMCIVHAPTFEKQQKWKSVGAKEADHKR